MVNYKRFVNAKMPSGYVYQCNGRIVGLERLPKYVTDRFDMGADSVEYDERPELPRCLFCDGYREHTRMFEGVAVALCGVHYYDKNIGQIAQKLREEREKVHGNAEPKRSPETEQPKPRHDRHRRRHAKAARSSGTGQRSKLQPQG